MADRKFSLKAIWSRTNTTNTSQENHEPSLRSRRSVLEGSKAFVWDSERPRTDVPYANRKYHEAFNPPPNELNFIGGIGKQKAHIRSKLHPSRPTLLQKISGMSRMNRINVSFTQPLEKSHNLLIRKKKMHNTDRVAINKIVQHISFSDFKNDRPPPSGSSSSSNVVTSPSMSRARPESTETTDDYLIDGKPFYVKQKSIKQQAHNAITKAVDKTISIDRVIEADRQFKTKADEARCKFKQPKLRPAPKRRPSVDSDESSITPAIGPKASKRNGVAGCRRRKRRQNNVECMHGHMFGPLQSPVGPDPLTVDSDKFGVPMTMINRVAKAQRKRRIRESYLRRIRFTHMGYIQPPDRDESSDNESLENVKKLALLRTPYFVIPTVKISQVRRKNRFRNKYLRKDRLKRINLLLSDRRNRLSGRETDEESDEDVQHDAGVVEAAAEHKEQEVDVKRQEFFAKFFELDPRKKLVSQRAPEKQKFYDLIASRYEEHRRSCEPQEKPSDRISFEQFKDMLQRDDVNQPTATVDDDDTQTHSHSPAERLEDGSHVLSKLFRRRKNNRLRRPDDVEGPLYTDPNLAEKLRDPRKFTSRAKTFVSLFNTRFGIRSRLQVNTAGMKDEQIGADKTYFSRLATEWDEYYIHELRHRPAVKKFRVKTDILKMRDVVRQNYMMYYTQENLQDLRAEQEAEVQALNAAENEQMECFRKYDEMATIAYGKVVERNINLEDIQCANKSLRIKLNALTNEFDKLTKDILIVEKDWEFLTLIQNYYYLLMGTEWREAHDWIHRDAAGNLLPPLVAIVDCAKRNMRDKSVCTAFAVKEHFVTEIEPKLHLMKAIIPDADLLRTSLNSLMKKSFATLTQHNKSLWTLKQITQMHQSLKDDMLTFQAVQGRKVALLKKKELFMHERFKALEQAGQKLLDRKLMMAMSSKMERKIMGISEVLYQRFAPPDNFTEQLIDDVNAMDKFTFLHRYCMELLRKLDELPAEILAICEKSTRDRRRQDKMLSKRAVIQQSRFEMWTKQIKHQFTSIPEFRRVNVVAPLRMRRCGKANVK